MLELNKKAGLRNYNSKRSDERKKEIKRISSFVEVDTVGDLPKEFSWKHML